MISIDELQLVDDAFSGYHIPSKPEILSKIEDEFKKEQPDMMVVADLIAADIGVSSVVLKTINSPFYGMRRTICEIKQAVMLLGLEVIRALVVGVILRTAYTQKSCISLERFWDSTTDIADTMMFLGKRIKNAVPQEKLYTLGLFQNCAIPAFAIKYPDYHKVLAHIDQQIDCIPTVVENTHYGSNHAVLGYFIANSWGLPKDICHIILNHHNKKFLEEEPNEEKRLIFATLKTAENLVNKTRRFKNTADWQYIGKPCLETLHIYDDDYDDLLDDVAELFGSL